MYKNYLKNIVLGLVVLAIGLWVVEPTVVYAQAKTTTPPKAAPAPPPNPTYGQALEIAPPVN
jgi:hypothetical protein